MQSTLRCRAFESEKRSSDVARDVYWQKDQTAFSSGDDELIEAAFHDLLQRAENVKEAASARLVLIHATYSLESALLAWRVAVVASRTQSRFGERVCLHFESLAGLALQQSLLKQWACAVTDARNSVDRGELVEVSHELIRRAGEVRTAKGK